MDSANKSSKAAEETKEGNDSLDSNNSWTAKPTKRSASTSTDTVSDVPAKRTAKSRSGTPQPSEIGNVDQNEPEISVLRSAYGISDVHIITTDFLKRLIVYAEYVKQKEEMYRYRFVENRKKDKLELFVAKLQPEGKLIGIRFNYETPPFIDNEYEYAQYEREKAETILGFKNLVEEGYRHFEDAPHMFVTNLNFNADDVTNAIKLDVIKHKDEKALWLKTECNLVELEAKVKDCLGLNIADPKTALEYLDKMLHLHIESLMLKKRPGVVDMVRRVRTYIGNVSEWKLTDEQREIFEFDAERLRNKADDVYRKFFNMFKVENERDFLNTFSGHIQAFRELTQNMCMDYIYNLTAEPLSRLAFFDAMDQAEEVEMDIFQLESDVDQIHVVEDSNPVS